VPWCALRKSLLEPEGAERSERSGFADLLAASAGGVSRGMPEDLPTSQMSDPKGSELAGTQGFEPR
jgi:hypothetical protein